MEREMCDFLFLGRRRARVSEGRGVVRLRAVRTNIYSRTTKKKEKDEKLEDEIGYYIALCFECAERRTRR